MTPGWEKSYHPSDHLTFDVVGDLRDHFERADSCKSHPELRRCESIEEAELWRSTVENCRPTARVEHLRWLARHDLYFLLVYLLHRWHLMGDREGWEKGESEALTAARHRDRNTRAANWCFARCREYQDDPWNYLDLWSREHFKSEIITFGANIQTLLVNPNETIGIFSHTRPIAKGFMGLIKAEFERNDELKSLFPDILYEDPEREAPYWGIDVGLYVKRKANRKEASVEAYGLVDGQPTSKRYTILSYDDVVSRKEISEGMIPRTTDEFMNSLMLTASDPVRYRYAATFQEIGDTTQQLIDRGYRARIRPGVLPGGDGETRSLCASDEKMAWFKESLSPKIFALQILLDPLKAKGEHQLGFLLEWLQYYDRSALSMASVNKYIFVDPASNSQWAESYYALNVVGLSPDWKYKWLDAVYDHLNLDERTEALKRMVLTYRPLCIFYEKQAMQADIEHIRGKMREELWECKIVQVGTNALSKDQRIEWLLPVFKGGLFQMPAQGISYTPLHLEGTPGTLDLVRLFVEREYSKWPISDKKDMLDCLSWLKWDGIKNDLSFPRRYGDQSTKTGAFGEVGNGTMGGWMSE